jgi:hypothetical protein
LLLAGVATCAVATCHPDVPPLHEPPLREAPPMGAPPEHSPTAPLAPSIGNPDRKVDAGAIAPAPVTSFEDRLPMRAVPAAVAPNKPPVDAGVDGPVSLPPVPDAGLIRDAGTPM